MTHLLDTNIIIYALKGSYPAIAVHMASHLPSDIAIPTIVKAELIYGAHKSNQRERIINILGEFLAPFSLLPFEEKSATAYGRIRSELERKGSPIGPNDLIIAATALVHAAVLVTHNTREFQKVEGLQLEDWTEERP